MRHRLLIVLFVFTSFTALASTPTLTVDDASGAKALALSRVEVHVLMRGHLARTTFDLTWRNDLDHDVGGSFTFPLPKGADVSDVALWFGDHLRHAVAVERVLAKRAYERTVHRRVDPALGEWISGRAFRLRVYPIPAHGTKSVHLAYDEELTSAPYTLDLRYGVNLEKFDVSIDADPDARIDAEGLLPPAARGNWHAGGAKKRLDALVHVTRVPDEQAIVAWSAEDRMWYASAPIEVRADSRPVAPAPHVIVLWDASGSASRRDSLRLGEWLDAFVARQQPGAGVTVVPFHVDVEPAIEVAPAALRITTSGIDSAGATNLAGLFETLPRIVANAPPGTRIVLVTDGISSVGDSRRLTRAIHGLEQLGRPITVVNAAPSPDEQVLHAIVRNSGGWFVDLNETAPAAAVEAAMRDPVRNAIESRWLPLRDMVASSDDDAVTVVSARSMQPIVAFPLVASGRRHDVVVRDVHLPSDAGDLVRRAWARARLHELLTAGAPAEEVLDLGRHFNQITPRTSLLVLEGWRDYERYGVAMPPDVEADKKAEEAAMTRGQPFRYTVVSRVSAPQARGARWFITGTVRDNDGDALPGVTVMFRPEGSLEIGVITDAQGHYWIMSATVPRSFTIEASLSGFRSAMQKFPDGATSGLAIDMILRAAVEETITVTAEAPLLDVRSAASGVNIVENETEEASITDVVKAEPEVVADRDTLRRAIAQMNAFISAADRFHAYAAARATSGFDKWFYAEAVESIHQLDPALGVRVASDLAEVWPDDAPLLRVIGRLLDGWGRSDLAHLLFERAHELSPDEPQTDHELRLLDERAASGVDARIDPNAALQVEIMWDTNDSDVDLHVVEPGGEEVYYSHLDSSHGGKLHGDVTTGFGPELYTIAQPVPGEYRVALVYFRGDRTEANLATLVHVVTYERGQRTDHLVALGNDKEREEVTTLR